MNEVTQPVRRRGKGWSTLALVAALTTFLAFAALASAASDPVASGSTSITLNKGFFKKMKKKKVKIQKISPATLSGRNLTLPVGEGEVDPTTGAAVLTHEGGFKFVHGKKKASVTELVLTSTTATLNAKVAGKKMKFAAVVGYTFARSGFDVTVNATRLKLTKKAAKQLNKKLGFPVKATKKGKKTIKPFFVANQVIGAANATTSPKTVTILSGAASLKTSEETTKKMVLPPPAGNGIEIIPIEPTQLEKDELNPFTPTLKFPVTGGNVAPNASAGKVETAGGIKLRQGIEVAPGVEKETVMTLNAIQVDLNSKTATVEVSLSSTLSEEINKLGNLGRSSIATVDLSGATITSDGENHRVTVLNATSALQAVTAETLNSVFGAPWKALEIPHPEFKEGDPLGTFSFTVQTQ